MGQFSSLANGSMESLLARFLLPHISFLYPLNRNFIQLLLSRLSGVNVPDLIVKILNAEKPSVSRQHVLVRSEQNLLH